MKDLNCPNCGAPITGDKCEYCGTLFRIKVHKEVARNVDAEPVTSAYDGLKMWWGSEEQYDAIDGKDANTIYYVEKEIGGDFFSINDLRRIAGLPPL